jgi:hypothetical protein
LARVYCESVFLICVGHLGLDEIAWLRMDSTQRQARDLATAVTKTLSIAANYDYNISDNHHPPDKTTGW